MMVWARLVILTRITVFTLIFAFLCPPAAPVKAADAETEMIAQEWFDRGCFMGEIGNYRKAVESFSMVLELFPESANAYNNRGVAYSEMGNYRLAIQDLNLAVAMNPDETLFRFNRGIAFGREQEYDLAITDLNRVLEMDPKHANARFFLGLLQRIMPGGTHKGADNIKTSARLGNKDAQKYLRSRFMGWY